MGVPGPSLNEGNGLRAHHACWLIFRLKAMSNRYGMFPLSLEMMLNLVRLGNGRMALDAVKRTSRTSKLVKALAQVCFLTGRSITVQQDQLERLDTSLSMKTARCAHVATGAASKRWLEEMQ